MTAAHSTSPTLASVPSAGAVRWGTGSDASRERVAALCAVGALVAAGAVAAGAHLLMAKVTRSLTPNPWAQLPIMALPALPVLDADAFVVGRAAFMATCATCHSPQGTGVPGLGKDLTRSLFVCELSDAELVAFMKKGREANDPLNTTRVPMPPKGGNPNFTDADLQAVAIYVRGLQDTRRVPDVPAFAPPPPRPAAAPTEAERTAALAAAGGDAELAEWIAHGTTLFAASCASCHGADAKGMQGLGKSLVDSAFVKSLDDDGLLAFLLRGRDPSDPANTTKIAMPPKGGNPALSEDDLLDIIAYIRSLHKRAAASAP